MFNIFFWIIFGVVTGWVATIVRDEKNTQRIGLHMGAGALGGLVGGVCGAMLDAAPLYNTGSTGLMFAVFGAITFVLLAGHVADRQS